MPIASKELSHTVILSHSGVSRGKDCTCERAARKLVLLLSLPCSDMKETKKDCHMSNPSYVYIYIYMNI